MSWRSNGGYFGPRPTGPSAAAASGWWDSRSQFRNRRDGQWPVSGDPFWSDVSLLLHMDGSNGSTTFTDASDNGFSGTAVGNAQISTTQSKFGGASASFDGNGDYVTFPSNAAFTLGSGDWTIECWCYFNSLPAASTPFGVNWNASTAYAAARLQVNSTGALRLLCSATGSAWNVDTTSAASAVTTATWHHIACVRSGNSFTVFRDGQSVATASYSGSLHDASGETWLGAVKLSPSLLHLNGYIDEFRLTKAARFTAAFTPASAPHPDGP